MISLVKEWNPSLKRHEFDLAPNARGDFSVWQQPNPERTYVLGLDVGEGNRDGDYSVIIVMDKQTMDVAAIWRGQPGHG